MSVLAEREAVATCQKCGKGLCRECAEKHTPCLCDLCAVQIQYDQQQQAQNKEEQRKLWQTPVATS